MRHDMYRFFHISCIDPNSKIPRMQYSIIMPSSFHCLHIVRALSEELFITNVYLSISV